MESFSYSTFAIKPYITWYADTEDEVYDFINENNITYLKFADCFKEIPDLSRIKTAVDFVVIEENNRLKLDNLIYLKDSIRTMKITHPVHKSFDFHNLPNLERIVYHWDKPEQGLRLFTHPNLKKLDINHIFVEEKDIKISPDLEFLILGFPKNETLGFLKNGNMKILDIQKPKNIANLHGLPSTIEELKIDDGPLECFDGISHLTNLRSFRTRSGYEGKIPDSIFSLKKLEKFCVTGKPTEFQWERFFEMPNISMLSLMMKAPAPTEEEMLAKLLTFGRKLTYYSRGGPKKQPLTTIKFEPM